jgi:hypothetical protein
MEQSHIRRDGTQYWGYAEDGTWGPLTKPIRERGPEVPRYSQICEAGLDFARAEILGPHPGLAPGTRGDAAARSPSGYLAVTQK